MIVFLFNSVIYVSLWLCLCIFIVMCVFYSVSLLCFVYCWCVNVYCTTATGCTVNVHCTTATGCTVNVYCTTATGCTVNVYCTTATRYFIDIKSFRSHYGPGVDSASNRNQYEDHFLGVKAAGS